MIYAIMYLVSAGLSIHQINGISAHLLMLLTLIIVATWAGVSLGFHSAKDIAPYSALWVLEIALLDWVFSVPYAGWALYADWNVWLGYALVLIVPLFATFAPRRLV